MEISIELLKGSLKSIVLKLLSEQDRMYGYEITQKVEKLSGGKIKLTYGALYPILHKLENDGLVNNRTRVYYKLTKTGYSTAEEKVNELQEFINTIKILISPNPALDLCRS